MDPKRWTFSFFLLSGLIGFATTSADSDTVRYLISVIKYLESTVTGVSSCVFYRMVTPDDILQDVLRARKLDSVAKFLVANNIGDSELSLIPAEHLLIVVEPKNLMDETTKFRNVLNVFSPTSKVLILIDTISRDFQFCTQIVRQLSFCNVIYLDVKRRRMFAVDLVKQVQLDYHTHPSGLFTGFMMRNMRGRPLTFVSKRWINRSRPCWKWMQETAAYMNTTLQMSVPNCTGSKVFVLRDECFIDHFLKYKVDIDLTNYHFNGVGSFGFRFLSTGLTDGVVILVPRSQLTFAQLFTFPFNWEVWVLVTLILGTAEILRLVFPSHFRNDAILLVVCGFERYDLNTSGRWEKLVLLSVMEFFFFTTCAYETKLLSMMVSKPATQEINTIQELVDSGIKIKVNLLGNPDAQQKNLLGSIMINSTETVMNMDMVHAHIVEREVAEMVLPKYYDPDQRLYRYRIMDQSLGIVPRLFVLAVRVPFKPVLEFTNAALLESGIINIYWPMLLRLKSDNSLLKPVEEAGDMLLFADMKPAWTALSIGLTLSGFVFVGEMCSKVVQ